jgi:uncharacterized membrane protein YphA (DoxX/SURF4 family)
MFDFILNYNISAIDQIGFLIGRIIVGCYFLMSGFNHFAQFNMLVGYSKSKGTPAPALAVGGSGVVLLLGGASLLFGYHPTAGTVLLVIALLGFSFGIHNFWTVQDPQAKMQDMTHFLKNMGLIGLLLMTLLIPRPWPMSLGH